MSFMNRSDIQQLVNEANDKYLYWSEVKYKKLPNDISALDLWSTIKLSRQMHHIFSWKDYGISVSITNQMQRYCHDFDMYFGGTWGNNSVIPSEDKERYLISSLMEKAISSSQMEGVATTRKAANSCSKISRSFKICRMNASRFAKFFAIETFSSFISIRLCKAIGFFLTFFAI